MAKSTSNAQHVISRFVKVLVGVSLVPPVVGLALGLYGQLALIGDEGTSFAFWVLWGMAAYVGAHLFLSKPSSLFGAQHRVLSRLAVWLFGGQVTTARPKGEERKAGKANAPSSSDSTLVMISPYLVPLYTIFICVVSWGLRHWVEARFLDPPTGVLIGASLAMHWVMSADALQQQRSRLPWEAYLLALTLAGLVSLLVVAACLPLAVETFSIPSALAEALSRTGGIYRTAIQRLFF